MSVTIIPWIVVLVFGGIFIFAGVREYLHRREHGPPEDPRASFDFDEDAPSYEEPKPDVSPDEPDDAEDTDGGDRAAQEDEPDDTPRQPPDRATDPEIKPKPDTPDRNETPR